MSARAALFALLLVLSGCGPAKTESVSAHAVRTALSARLMDRNLSYRWIVCVSTGRAFAGRPIFRCNVNFGEPHIVRYCATLDAGRLVTNREQPRIRCSRHAAS